jgi:mannosyltransferase
MKTSISRDTRILLVTVAAIFLSALALRLYAIDAQSLWSDEGSTIALSSRSFEQILRDTAQDVHPPLYYWILHAWMDLVGSSVFAVRSLSAVCGALTVAITYILGRRWFGTPSAVVATIAATLSPLAIYYSQETRMYALLMLLSALAWLALDGWLTSVRWYLLVLSWLITLAAISTHYFAATLIAATGLIWLVSLIVWVRQQRRTPAALSRIRVRQWIIWAILLGVAVLLLVALVWRNRMTLLNWPTIARESFGPAYVLSDTLRVFSQGTSGAPGWSFWMVGFLGLLVVGALAGSRRSGLVDGHTLALAWLFVPVVPMLVLAFNQPFYQPRFLLLVLPAFHLLIGHGAATLGKWLSTPRLIALAAAIFIVLAARGPLTNEWYNPAFWRDDYRGIARYITDTAGPNDAIMMMGQGQVETLDYYYKGTLPHYLLPRFRPLDRDATVHDLKDISRRHRRLYALFYVPYEADPNGVIADWLQTNAFKVNNRWYGGVELVVYEFGDLRAALRPMDARFGQHVRLGQIATSPSIVHAGDAVRIAFVWRSDATLDQPLNLFVHLLDDTGKIIAQYDGPSAQRPATEWATGKSQPGRAAVLVPPGTAPGDYHLVAGLYEPTGERLRLSDGADTLLLTQIKVVDQ